MIEQEQDRILNQLARDVAELREQVKELRKLLEGITGMSSAAINQSQQVVRCPLAK